LTKVSNFLNSSSPGKIPWNHIGIFKGLAKRFAIYAPHMKRHQKRFFELGGGRQKGWEGGIEKEN